MRVAGGRGAHVVGAAAIVFTVCAGALANSRAQEPAAGLPVEVLSAKTGIWTGVYTEAQARRGEIVSGKVCVSCHGPDLSGGEAGPALAGLEFMGNWSALSVGDLFARVHASMPADAPGTLTQQQTADLAAYVLKLNKYPAGKAELPTDLAALQQIIIEGQPPAK
jgi:cytochrome c553